MIAMHRHPLTNTGMSKKTPAKSQQRRERHGRMPVSKMLEQERPEDETLRLDTAIHISGDGIILIDLEGKIHDVNEAALRLVGLSSQDDLVGKRAVDFLLAKDRPRALANLQKRLAGEQIGNQEFELVLATNERCCVELNTTVLYNARKQPIGFVIVIRDITTRRQTEDQLRYRLVIEEAIADVSRIFATTTDPDLQHVLQILGKAVGANRVYIFRLRKDDRTLDNTHEWCDENTTPEIAHLQGVDSSLIQEVMALLRRGESFVVSNVNTLSNKVLRGHFQRQGTRALLAVPLCNSDGTLLGFLGFADAEPNREWSVGDIRLLRVASEILVNAWARKQTEEALRQSQERFALIFQSSKDGLWDWDIVAKKVFLSPHYQEQLGYKEQELDTHANVIPSRLIHSDDHDRTLQALRDHLTKRTPCQMEFRVQTKSGQYRWFESYAQGLWNDAGQPIRMAGSLRDITARKEASEHLESQIKERTAELAQTNASLAAHVKELTAVNQELGSLSYTIAHDLRAPLRHINGFVDLLAKKLPDLDDKGRHYLAVIADTAKRMGTQIDDLLAFLWTGRKQIQSMRVALGQIVQEVAHERARATHGRNIHWNIGSCPGVQGDPTMLRMVLTHLINNAVKYTSSRTLAQITVDCTTLTAHEVVWFIRDNGIGFDMQYADKIFDIFQRWHHTKEFEGTGIGLALVRRIIQRHGGRIWAEAAVDHGATFHVALPLPINGG
jgi:PAS domain S-box-containing protein